ncbi:tyrosine-protein kinase receptor, partial [Elysia marginata]
VQACHGLDYGSYETCGRKGIHGAQTLPDSFYDAINESTVHISKVESNRTGDRLITWDEPARPNGQILRHMLHLQRLDEVSPSSL